MYDQGPLGPRALNKVSARPRQPGGRHAVILLGDTSSRDGRLRAVQGWLDLAESELGVLSSQCLDRRIPDIQILIDEIQAWQHDRNAKHTKANWHFTTPNARIKLNHLYPSI